MIKTKLLSVAVAVLLGIAPVTADTLKDIEHVVIFMQENRSWDSYFGTMPGVRGFNDPNVQVNPDGKSVWYQQVDPDMSDKTDSLLPFYLAYLGGNWSEAIQCIEAGDNGYDTNQASLNHGLNNHWARNNTPWSWGYHKREDIPVHFALAEGWTSGDMYQEGQIASTNPNRVTHVTGSINTPGSPQNPDEGGAVLDNNETPGCVMPGVSCYPLKWKTVYEFYEEAGVSWQVYQDEDNFDDNPLAWFEQFQKAKKQDPLAKKGLAYLGLDAFYEDAAAGTLPEVSYIVAPKELSEHPPWMPKEGAWLQKQVVDAVVNSPKYNKTMLMISYDETGGFGDHVTPFHSPQGTPGEWLEDPYGLFGEVYTGPGFRVPFYMISPWTRGNRVFTERADHNSQILFVEEWLAARGYSNIKTDEMVAWRRSHMSNLVNALDLENPDYSIPHIPDIAAPLTNKKGEYIETAQCQSLYPVQRPPVPYGEQTLDDALFFEDGFKEVIGSLTEGRYLVLEKSSVALTNTGKGARLSVSAATDDHKPKSQRWVVHYTGDPESGIFTISSALDGRWLGSDAKLVKQSSQAAPIKIEFIASQGYTLQYVDGSYLDVASDGSLNVAGSQKPADGYKLFSVTYHS